MKLPATHRWRLGGAAVLAVALLAYCGNTIPSQWKTPNMTAMSPRLQALFEKTKTVCVGRALVDVPESAIVAWGNTQVVVDVEVIENAADTLDQRVAEFEAQSKSEVRFPRTEGRNLYDETISGVLPLQKMVIGQIDFDNSYQIRIDSLYPMGNSLVWMHAIPPKDYQSETVADLNSMARRLRPLQEGEIPNEAGVCINHGVLMDKPGGLPKGDDAWQNIEIGFRLKEFPDTHFSLGLSSATKDPSTESLESHLQRMDDDANASPDRFWWSQIKTFRRGPRKVSDWLDGFETLRYLPKDKSILPHHDFWMKAVGVFDDPLKPLTDIRLHTGVKDDVVGATTPLLTDAEVIALWDKLVESIRVRPTSAGGSARTSQAEPAKFPLGELAATGRNCPQTGWWESVDEGRMPERRQYFEEGARMPRVLVLVEPNAWQRLRGQQPRYRAPTVWKLVGYEPRPASG